MVLFRSAADDRPVSGVGRGREHFTAFALVGAVFAIGYRFSLIRLLVLAVFYCAGIELLQIPLPTRHARVSDFLTTLPGLVLRFFVFLSPHKFGVATTKNGMFDLSRGPPCKKAAARCEAASSCRA